MRPNIARGDQVASGLNARMSQIMNVMENGLAERLRNKRTEVAGGDITMKRKAKHLVLGMLERGRMEQLLGLRTRGLLLSKLERRKGRHSSSRKRGKKRSNEWWGGGRGPRKGISNSIGEARSMLYSNENSERKASCRC